MSDHRYTVGVVGLGFGRAHIPAYQANGCDVIAVCQRDEASAKVIADRHRIRQVYTRWEDMLERVRPDIVSIATPPALHRAIATAAFAHGAHVLCEKPVAMNRAEARSMVDAARRAKRVAMTCFNWRFPLAMQSLHARAAHGDVGRVFHVMGRWLGGRWADQTVAPTWRMDRSQAGHGAMGDMGVHMIDMIRWTFGDFARLSAHAGIAYPSRTVPGGAKAADADDYCTVVAELVSGAQVTFTVTRVARGASDHGIEVYGENAAMRYRFDRELPRWWEGDLRVAGTGAFHAVSIGNRSGDTPEGDPVEVIGKAMITPLIARMLDGIEKGETPSPSLEDGLCAQAVLDAVLESLARGGWVDVPR